MKLLLCICSISITLFFIQPSLASTEEEVLSFAVDHKYQSLDPIYSTGRGEYHVLHNTAEGLTTFDPNGQIVPGMAESWSVSEDGLSYTFHLRPELRWSDGHPLVAQDFVNTLQRMHNTKNNLFEKPDWLTKLLRNSEDILAGKQPADSLGAEAKDERTLILHLKRPASYIPTLVSNPIYTPTPRHLMKQHPDDWHKPKHIVTNGPYRPAREQTRKGLLLEKNLSYYAADQVHFPYLYLERQASKNRALSLLNSRYFDVAYYKPSLELTFQQLQAPDKEITIYPNAEMGVRYISLNLRYAPLQNLNLRQALSLATDKHALVQQIAGESESAIDSFAPPSPATYWQPQASSAREQAARLDQAKKLMEKLGYHGMKRLSLRLNTYETDIGKKLAAQLQQDWAQIGIDLFIHTQPLKEHYQLMSQGQYQLALAGWRQNFDNPLATLDVLSSTSEINDGQWHNAAYDDLLEGLNQAGLTGEKEHSLYQQMEQLIAAEIPLIPLHYYNDYFLVSKRIQLLPQPEKARVLLLKHLRPVSVRENK